MCSVFVLVPVKSKLYDYAASFFSALSKNKANKCKDDSF